MMMKKKKKNEIEKEKEKEKPLKLIVTYAQPLAPLCTDAWAFFSSFSF